MKMYVQVYTNILLYTHISPKWCLALQLVKGVSTWVKG
jgi:hypothetical protein